MFQLLIDKIMQNYQLAMNKWHVLFFSSFQNIVFYDCITNLFKLKIRIDRKAELLNEYLLEGRNIVLFIKKQHSLFVVDAIYSSE